MHDLLNTTLSILRWASSTSMPQGCVLPPAVWAECQEKDSSRSISGMANHTVGKSYLATLSHMLSGNPICGATLRFFHFWTEAVPIELIENAEKVI